MSSKKKKSPATDKSPPAKQLTLDTVLKVLGALVGVASLTFGIYQYRTRFRSDERRQQQERIASQYKLKQDLYAKAMKSATDFAGASTAAEADTAKKDFWGLYWGQRRGRKRGRESRHANLRWRDQNVGRKERPVGFHTTVRHRILSRRVRQTKRQD